MTRTVTNGRGNTLLRTIKIKADQEHKRTSPNGRHTQDGSSEKAGDQVQHNGIPLEEIVNKGLDLAEAGIGMGFNIVTRLGTIFKDQVFDKINTSDMLSSVMGNHGASPAHAGDYPAPPGASPAERQQPQTPSSGEAAQSGAATQAYYLHNRLPLLPGGEAAIPFSINNDSLTADKKIRIAVEGFIGEAQHAALDAGAFSVAPAEVSIAPADFEKFVLKGKIPAEVPADNYHGWLIVAEQEVYRIPVILVVSAPDQTSTKAAA